MKVLIYSLGNKKQILWGVYDFKTQTFEWESGCKYKISMLTKFLKIWHSAGYETIADVVKNRISAVVAEIIGSKNQLTQNERYFKIYYIILRW